MITCQRCGRDTYPDTLTVGETVIVERRCTGCRSPYEACECDPLPAHALLDLVRAQVDGMGELLTVQRAILERLQVERKAPATFDLPLQTHQRIHVYYVVLGSSVPATLTLEIGTDIHRTYLLNTETRVFPLRQVIGRGIDVDVSASAGTPFGYLIADYD